MAEVFRRPGPYVPLSVTFATGRTGTAIMDRFGWEGLGVWVAMLAAAGVGNRGQIVFAHEADWAALGAVEAPSGFSLPELLKFLGQRKQTRTTRQGHVMYVEITQWERWNHIRKTEDARRRMSRKRRESARNTQRTESEHEANEKRTPSEVSAYPDTDTEVVLRQDKTSRSKTTNEDRPDLTEQEPEWATAGEQAPLNGEPEYREMTPLSEEVEKVRRDWAEAS